MSVLAVSTPFNIDLELTLAPFGKRLAAWLIDLAIMIAYTFGFFRFVMPETSGSESFATLIGMLGVGVPIMLYHFLQEVFFSGQSLGKRALRIRVVDMQGNEPTISQSLLRQVLRLVDILMTSGMCALISALVTKNAQRVGDLVAGTVVIENKPKASITETIYLPIERDSYTARFPEVMRLSDRDLNGIRNLLAAKPTKDTDAYATQIALRIQEVLGIQSDLPSRDFMQQLLEDYNFLSGQR